MILAKIRNIYNDLTDREQRIASYVLLNPDEVTHMTAKAVAAECATVQSAVISFCKSIGVDGFAKFKIMLAQELGNMRSNEPLPAFDETDDTQAVFNKVFNSGIRTLSDTLKMLDFENIKVITKKLFEAERIFIFGVGTSSVIAIDANYRFSQFGFQSYAYTDVLFMNVMAVNMNPGDVAIGISHSGRTKVVVDAIRHAKSAGASTIALCSFVNSPLCKESDHSISVYADEENYPVEAVSARMAHMCIIDAIMMTLATMKYDDFSEYISKRNQILNEIRYK